MIGNDVVDLQLAHSESNWQRRGFLDKIFTPNEKRFILNSENPEIWVWNLWSRKEAVYKIYNRQTGIRAFIPHKIECFDFESQIGKVVCEDKIYHTQTEISETMIHSIAVTQLTDFQNIFIPDSSSVIRKNGDIPYILGSDDFISISYHGNFYKIVGLKT